MAKRVKTGRAHDEELCALHTSAADWVCICACRERCGDRDGVQQMHRAVLRRLATPSSSLLSHVRLSGRSQRTSSLNATSPFTTPVMTASSAAQKPAFTAVVKGMPEAGELRDCPFSHRVLLTLEAKARHRAVLRAQGTPVVARLWERLML